MHCNINLVLICVINALQWFKGKANPLSIPAVYLGPEHPNSAVTIPAAASRRPHVRTMLFTRPEMKYILRKFHKTQRQQRHVNSVSPVIISRLYPQDPSFVHPMSSRKHKSKFRVVHRNYPAMRTRFSKPQHLLHSRRNNHRGHLMSALRKLKKTGCFRQEQHPQLYTILNAALDSIENYTVVNISYGTVSLYKRCSWKGCVAHRYEVRTEFTVAPSDGCDGICTCTEREYLSNVTCRANATFLHPTNEMNNLTLHCDKTIISQTTTEMAENSDEKNSSDELPKNNLTDHKVINGSTIENKQNPKSENGTTASDEQNDLEASLIELFFPDGEPSK